MQSYNIRFNKQRMSAFYFLLAIGFIYILILMMYKGLKYSDFVIKRRAPDEYMESKIESFELGVVDREAITKLESS